MTIRPIDPRTPGEVELVAERMRLTLMEVLGPERGRDYYPLDWLIDRVRFHLDPRRSAGAVWVAEDTDGALIGHTIVREERDEQGTYGLFSTTFVAPDARRQGVARALVDEGEAWMKARGLHRAATATAADNSKLIGLFRERGYRIVVRSGEMVRLEGRLVG
ncbi:MAG: GNAT family N-acetyltransferase [Alphaproteobacteria bacterium]|nr:GNAT family N-acetyltransferase [Alphaproteobacteria bacterium]